MYGPAKKSLPTVAVWVYPVEVSLPDLTDKSNGLLIHFYCIKTTQGAMIMLACVEQYSGECEPVC
jgi:hypothetical protein